MFSMDRKEDRIRLGVGGREAGRLGADARRWRAHREGGQARPAHAAAVGQAGAGRIMPLFSVQVNLLPALPS